MEIRRQLASNELKETGLQSEGGPCGSPAAVRSALREDAVASSRKDSSGDSGSAETRG